MFEAKFDRASTLKRIIDAISFLTEVNFDCTSTGIALQALDPAHVSLVSLLIRHDGFEFYRCDRAMTLGINLESLSKILKCAGNEDSLTIRADDNGDHITFIFEYKNKVSEFELKLTEIDLEKLNIPDSEYVATVKMPASEFQKTISSLTTLGDVVTISVTKGGVRFSVSGECNGSTTVLQNAELDDDVATTITKKEDITLAFAMRYLNYFTKATNLSSSVGLSLSSEVPLLVEYQIEDAGSSFVAKKEDDDKKKVKSSSAGRRQRGYIRYYLAPKIDDE